MHCRTIAFLCILALLFVFITGVGCVASISSFGFQAVQPLTRIQDTHNAALVTVHNYLAAHSAILSSGRPYCQGL